MFSQGHLIWIGISAILIAGGLFLCMCKRPPLRRVLAVSMALGAVSEVIKIFSVAEIVPMVDPVIAESGGSTVLQWVPTGQYTPYLAMEHLPLELCSLFLLFNLLALTMKEGKLKKWLYAVMFASGTLGGLMGIALSSIAGYYTTTAAFFSSVRAWQFFLFHSMIVVVSIYLGLSGESGLVFSDWKKAIIGLVVLDLPTFYLNSVFSSEVYVHDKVVGVTHRINFFSSYVNPLGLILTEKWQWITYLIIRGACALAAVVLLYLLLRKKEVVYMESDRIERIE